MCVTICGRFDPNEGGVVGYVDRMRAKYTAKWGVHMAGMNFQTRSSVPSSQFLEFAFLSNSVIFYKKKVFGGCRLWHAIL